VRNGPYQPGVGPRPASGLARQRATGTVNGSVGPTILANAASRITDRETQSGCDTRVEFGPAESAQRAAIPSHVRRKRSNDEDRGIGYGRPVACEGESSSVIEVSGRAAIIGEDCRRPRRT